MGVGDVDDARAAALNDAVDGFLMALSSDGDIVYVTENVHTYLGIAQVGYRVFFSINFSLPGFPVFWPVSIKATNSATCNANDRMEPSSLLLLLLLLSL